MTSLRKFCSAVSGTFCDFSNHTINACSPKRLQKKTLQSGWKKWWRNWRKFDLKLILSQKTEQLKVPVTFSMSCQIFTSILFPSLENIQEDLPKSWKVMLKNSLKTNKKKCCLLCRYFISISKINRSLHGRLGIQISFSRAESISHSKMKFVSPRSHVISSIFAVIDVNRCFVRWDREIHILNPCFRACPQDWTPLFH